MSLEDFTKMPVYPVPNAFGTGVWQLGFKLIVKIYKITKGFPSDERFGLISDMRRALNKL